MVSRNDPDTSRLKEKRDSPRQASRRYSSRYSQTTEMLMTDDLIVSLADAYENQRARQVSEWERMRRTVQHSA